MFLINFISNITEINRMLHFGLLYIEPYILGYLATPLKSNTLGGESRNFRNSPFRNSEMIALKWLCNQSKHILLGLFSAVCV